MNLPNGERARVDREKITEYLLSDDHPDGKSKADFFRRFGFKPSSWQLLARALQDHGAMHEVVAVRESRHGTRYVVDGELGAADGRRPRIRTVWVVEPGALEPRLITAYPIG